MTTMTTKKSWIKVRNVILYCSVSLKHFIEPHFMKSQPYTCSVTFELVNFWNEKTAMVILIGVHCNSIFCTLYFEVFKINC